MRFIENAQVMANGQIILSKDIRSRLHLSVGDRVTLICDEDRVIVMNSAVYAMTMLQRAMEGAVKKGDMPSDNDVVAWVKAIRAEDDAE